MVAYFPQHINLEKCDDGYTPLHSAVINNRVDVAHFLMAQVSYSSPHIFTHHTHTYIYTHVILYTYTPEKCCLVYTVKNLTIFMLI